MAAFLKAFAFMDTFAFYPQIFVKFSLKVGPTKFNRLRFNWFSEHTGFCGEFGFHKSAIFENKLPIIRKLKAKRCITDSETNYSEIKLYYSTRMRSTPKNWYLKYVKYGSTDLRVQILSIWMIQTTQDISTQSKPLIAE